MTHDHGPSCDCHTGELSVGVISADVLSRHMVDAYALRFTAGDLEPGAPYPPLRDKQSQMRALEMYQEGFHRRTGELAERLRAGELSVAEWEMAMRDEIRDLHVAATVIGKGGDRGAVSFSEWGRAGAYIKQQYGFLHRFAQRVERSAMNALVGQGEFVSEAYLRWRSSLYAGGGKASYYRGKYMGMLPQVPGDGQTQCLGNCKCYLTVEEGEYPWIVNVTWNMTPAEHCPDCVTLAAEWNPYALELPLGLDAAEIAYWANLRADEFLLDRRQAIALGG